VIVIERLITLEVSKETSLAMNFPLKRRPIRRSLARQVVFNGIGNVMRGNLKVVLG